MGRPDSTASEKKGAVGFCHMQGVARIPSHSIPHDPATRVGGALHIILGIGSAHPHVTLVDPALGQQPETPGGAIVELLSIDVLVDGAVRL